MAVEGPFPPKLSYDSTISDTSFILRSQVTDSTAPFSSTGSREGVSSGAYLGSEKALEGRSEQDQEVPEVYADFTHWTLTSQGTMKGFLSIPTL